MKGSSREFIKIIIATGKVSLQNERPGSFWRTYAIQEPLPIGVAYAGGEHAVSRD